MTLTLNLEDILVIHDELSRGYMKCTYIFGLIILIMFGIILYLIWNNQNQSNQNQLQSNQNQLPYDYNYIPIVE